jgi:hypothetical protein
MVYCYFIINSWEWKINVSHRENVKIFKFICLLRGKYFYLHSNNEEIFFLKDCCSCGCKWVNFYLQSACLIVQALFISKNSIIFLDLIKIFANFILVIHVGCEQTWHWFKYLYWHSCKYFVVFNFLFDYIVFHEKIKRKS